MTLLERYKPQPRYDSQEAFFADSAEEMTANPGNQLRRADGTVIAETGSGLDLKTLGSTYPDGSAAQASDVLGIQGKDYRTQYSRLRTARADLRNVVYGHTQTDPDGKLWLQYWFWYFYNDYQLAAGFGLHEGDWEMVELRLPPDGAGDPEIALYAQHAYAESRPWDQVEKTSDGRPVTYPGRGSHASYFAPGLYETEGWYDIVNGKREAPELTLVVPEHERWIEWPGSWGDSKPSGGLFAGLEDPSPPGPAQHPYWLHPEQLLEKAIDRPLKHPAQPPELDATLEHGNLWVKLDLAGHQLAGTLHKLLATVNSRDEKGVPPKTFTFDIASQDPTGGRFDTHLELDPHKHWEVDVSLIVLQGDAEVPTASRCCPLEPGVQSKIPAWVKHPIWAIEQFVSKL